MKIKTLLCLVILVLAISAQSFTIPRNNALLASSEIKDSSALYFNFSNANFLWNNEFFNDVVEGYTLIGYWISPQLQYHFSPSLRIDAGAHFLKYSGIDSYSTILPTYAITYSKNDYSLTMGTLSGTVHHNLSEPLFYSERYFTDNIENGVQYLLNKNKIGLDVWLDWRSFIFHGEDKQEELIFGVNAIPQLLKTNGFKLEGVASLLAGHRGGQIDVSANNMKTVFNYGLGFCASKSINFKWMDEISLESQYVGFYDNSPTVESIYEQGGGVLNNLRFSKKDSYFQVGYWSSNKYLSLMGHPIYQSFSSVDPLLHKEKRNLITANIFYSKSIYQGVYLGLMGDLFYDIDTKTTDYSMGLTLIVNHDFFISRFKK